MKTKRCGRPHVASAEGAKALEGTWDVVATLRDCASGAAIRRLTAYGAQDGFISETRVLEVNGDNFTADGSAVITLANGAQIPACATEAGTRLY